MVRDGEAQEAGPLSRRAQNRARTTAAILAAAKRCIADRGVPATTMDEIAVAAAVSRATLFNYFPGKADVVTALVEQIEMGFYTAVAAWRAADGYGVGARLLGLFAATARYLRRASAVERMLVGVSWLNWNDASAAARIERLVAAFEALLADGRTRGEIATAVDLRTATEIVVNSYVGAIHAWRMDASYPAAVRLETAARLLATMLSPGVVLPARPPRLPRD